MTVEAGHNAEFMHKPGELFIVYEELHILAQVYHGLTPADSECEDYEGLCGVLSQSWSMPLESIERAVFVASLEEGEKKGAGKCSECFRGRET
jgi:hypothetical protein